MGHNKLKLFITALLQVTMVSSNVVFISEKMLIPMFITGFLISLIWTFNVSKVAFSNLNDKICYATGAMCGTGLGMLLSTWIKLQL